MLFREMFTIMVPVDDPFASTSEAREIFSLALHSRHTVVGDDGSFVTDETKCLEKMLPLNRTPETCAVYLMSDRPMTVKSLISWLQSKNCTGVAANPVDDGILSALVLTDEMGPNQGIGFIQELDLSTRARSGLIGDFRRSSFMLLVELIEYDRRIEDWKNGRESPNKILRCDIPERYGLGYDYGPGTPTFRSHRRQKPLEPIQVLNQYKADHSVEALLVDSSNSSASRSFVIGYLPCPLDKSTDDLHAFLNGKYLV
jgi:hypothetical protein